MRRIRHIMVGVHPSFYQKMEELRKFYREGSGIELSQKDITNIISKRIRMPKAEKLDLIGGNYAKKKRFSN